MHQKLLDVALLVNSLIKHSVCALRRYPPDLKEVIFNLILLRQDGHTNRRFTQNTLFKAHDTDSFSM